jgi:hypothetical protein
MRNLKLAFQAEVALGALLVVRHRTPRLASMLVILLVAATLMTVQEVTTTKCVWLSLVAAGSLAAVAGSRLLAPGANLVAGCRIGSPWWLVPSGRLVGGLLALFPVVAAVGLVLGAAGLSPRGSLRLSVLIVCYSATSASLIMALAPGVGASAAAAVGFLLAWFGTVPPSAVALAVDQWPLVRSPLVIAWNTLPLAWRAVRWFEGGGVLDCGWFVGWLLAGVALAAFSLSSRYRSEDRTPRGQL